MHSRFAIFTIVFFIKCNKHSEERTNDWRGERDKNCVNWIRSENATQTKTTNACPTLGYPAYKHLIRIYAANTCINYVKNEFITTPAHSPITQGLNILFYFFFIYSAVFSISDWFLSLTAVSRFLLEYLFAFHSDFDTPFLLLFIPFSVEVRARGMCVWIRKIRCVESSHGADTIISTCSAALF